MKDIFPYRNLAQFLEEKGLLNGSGSEIDKAKKTYRKMYQRHYRRQQKAKQLNLWLHQADVEFLEVKAKHSGYTKVQRYILHLIQSDREGVHIRPNLLIDTEVALLKLLDSLSKKMGVSKEKRAALIDAYRQIEELVILLSQ